MKKSIIAFFLLIISFSFNISAQIPTGVLVQIVKAEDERRFDKTLENLIKSPNPQISKRAILAAGRIGDEAAVSVLAGMVDSLGRYPEVDAMAAFALGEIESVKAADDIMNALRDSKIHAPVKSRAIEAAGKIAAANPNEAKSKELGKTILETLENQARYPKQQDREIILFGLTAVLRARPEGGDAVTAKFLTSADARIRIDAANTLTRIRAKNANEALRAMLTSDTDAVARANAARALGAAEDKDALEILLKAAVSDKDSRVRVSAIRSVGSLRDPSAAPRLLQHGAALLETFKKTQKPNHAPVEKSEILEIATVLGRLLTNTNDELAVEFLNDFRQLDRFVSPETEIALARITPPRYLESLIDDPEKTFGADWHTSAAAFQGLGEIANLEASAENDKVKSATRVLLVQLISAWLSSDEKTKSLDNAKMAVPALLRAFAAFKSDNTSGIFRPILEDEPDLFIRAAVAEILGSQPASKENIDALRKAFDYSYLNDKNSDDATLAIMDALYKLDKKEASATLLTALSSSNFLVRKKAFELLSDKDLQKENPGIPALLENALAKKKNRVLSFTSGSRLGIVNSTNADYTRAVSRKNGSVKAVLTTEKGAFTIDLAPEDAPLTVDNFIKLARAGYFNGLAVHRVVPNFVMQDGDPRGDGSGGPGWSIRCEINMLEYSRGAVGMALSGKDTGGSQWFVTHSPQPHLDGGYTVFGRVNESDMKIVDSIVRGDKILSVKIVEGKTPAKRAGK